MQLKIKFVTLLISALIAFTSQSKAQNTTNDEPPVKVNTFLVNIPVIASDRDGRYISGLKIDNFSILQDGEKQNIEFFADENAPVTVAILIDGSYSTKPVFDSISSAAKNFIKILRPEDQAMIASFDNDINILCEMTSDRKKLNKGIDRAASKIGSNMQDAMYRLATSSFASVKGRKAIIVLTDGFVGGRVISNQKLLDTLAESDILVYPILFNTGFNFTRDLKPRSVKLPNGQIISADEMRRRALEGEKQRVLFINSLGTVTGGRLYENTSSDFKKSFQNIADELKHQYLVGFYPQNVDDGKPHKILVEVNPKDIVIRTKRKIQLKVSNRN